MKDFLLHLIIFKACVCALIANPKYNFDVKPILSDIDLSRLCILGSIDEEKEPFFFLKILTNAHVTKIIMGNKNSTARIALAVCPVFLLSIG